MSEFYVRGGSHDGAVIELSDDFPVPFFCMRPKRKPQWTLLGEALVPGSVSTERYRVDRASGALIFVD